MAVLETISGLVLFWVVMSKLVTAKQEAILEEVYELSFDEKLTRLRSALTLFRKDAARFLERVTARDFLKKDQRDMGIFLASLEGTLADVVKLTNPARHDSNIKKQIEHFQLELLLTSVAAAFTRLLDLLVQLDFLGIEWRQSYVLDRISHVRDYGQSLVVHQRKQKMSPKLGLLVDEVEKLVGDVGFVQEHEKAKNAPLAQWV